MSLHVVEEMILLSDFKPLKAREIKLKPIQFKVEEPVQVMEARISEMLSLIAQNLSKDNINIASIDRVVVVGDGLVPFKGLDILCENILKIKFMEIDFSRLTGMKSIYTYASGMVMYVSSQLPLGRKQSKLEKEFSSEEPLMVKKKGFTEVINKIYGKMKDMFTGFRE